MSGVTKKMVEAGGGRWPGGGEATAAAKEVQRFRCESCGLEVEVKPRRRGRGECRLRCCGREMRKT